MFLSKDDMITSFDDSDFVLDETELESLLSDLPELVSDDEYDDLEIDPIPLNEISPGDGSQALIEYASSLGSCFISNDAPIKDDHSMEVKPPRNKNHKTTKSKKRTTIEKQTSNARSGKKTVSKRKLTPKINYTPSSLVTGLCPERDVVFGRGGHANHNPGNGFLLEAVKANSLEYKRLGKDREGKEEKKCIVEEIAAMIHARGGRFLMRQHKDAPWQEASEKKVHEKISHMLRDQPLEAKQ